MSNPTITFIGAGHMAGSLIHGLVKDDYPVDCIWATAPIADRLGFLKQRYQIHVTEDNAEGAKHADILVLAVKPQDAKEALGSLKIVVAKRKPLIISVITGWVVEDIQKQLDCQELSVVRCVPNTPALVASGATGLYANDRCSQEQKDLAESILRAVSMTLWIEDESLMNAVTALSGSGPAYFFAVIEALQKAGKDLGLPEETAKLLTLQTAFGAAKMALESDQDVSVLREQVTSKGGTTEQALKVLNSQGLSKLLAEAVKAAFERAKTLKD